MVHSSQHWLEHFLSLHPAEIDLSLGRMYRLLEALDNPHLKLPPVVHIAGTNGKGSTLAFLAAMLRAGGFKVQAYTSPHLVQFHERIRLADGHISDDHLATILADVAARNQKESITFFEATTAAAFLAFSRFEGDILLLETGLGGRLDATNVIDTPALTLISTIGLDHQDFLGDSLDQIAAEKAGIMKPGVAVICTAQEPVVQQVLSQKSADVTAPLLIGGIDWFCQRQEQSLLYKDQFTGETAYPLPNLIGPHQLDNAALAIAAAKNLPLYGLCDLAIGRGLQSADWPARLQKMATGPYHALLPANWELWLDGGHNPSAADRLAEQMASWSDRPLHLIIGMLNTKDVEGFLTPILPFAASLQCLDIANEPKALTARDLQNRCQALGINSTCAADLKSALLSLPVNCRARVLICGSLYLAGNVLANRA